MVSPSYSSSKASPSHNFSKEQLVFIPNVTDIDTIKEQQEQDNFYSNHHDHEQHQQDDDDDDNCIYKSDSNGTIIRIKKPETFDTEPTTAMSEEEEEGGWSSPGVLEQYPDKRHDEDFSQHATYDNDDAHGMKWPMLPFFQYCIRASPSHSFTDNQDSNIVASQSNFDFHPSFSNATPQNNEEYKYAASADCQRVETANSVASSSLAASSSVHAEKNEQSPEVFLPCEPEQEDSLLPGSVCAKSFLSDTSSLSSSHMSHNQNPNEQGKQKPQQLLSQDKFPMITPASTTESLDGIPIINHTSTTEISESYSSNLIDSKIEELHILAYNEEQNGNLKEAIQHQEEALIYLNMKQQEHDCDYISHKASTCHHLGVLFWKDGSYEEALEYLESAWKSYRSYRSEDTGFCSKHLYSFEICDTLRTIGNVYLSKGQYENAMCFFKKSLTLGKQHHAVFLRKCDENHLDPNVAAVVAGVARSKIGMGMSHDATGNYHKAMEYYQKGLYLQQKTLLPNHMNVGLTLNCIGVLHEKMGRYDEAMQTYSEALWAYRIGSSPQQQENSNFHDSTRSSLLSTPVNVDVDVAITLINMSIIHRQFGEYEQALAALEEALQYFTSGGLPKEHRNVATTMYHIATIQVATANGCKSKLDNALDIYRDVLKSQRVSLGDDHLDVAVTLDAMGNTYEKRQRWEKAKIVYQRALKLRKAVLGKQHVFVGITMHQLGTFHVRTGEVKEALKYLSGALRLFKNIPTGQMKQVPLRVKEVASSLEALRVKVSS